MGCVLCLGLLGGIVIVCFALGWVVCINRAEFSGVGFVL